jgi:hypothetical protein
MTRADTIAVLENHKAAIKRKLLQGFRVMTSTAQYGLVIKGNFANQADTFDPSRHRVEAQINLSPELRRAIMNKVSVEKQLAIAPQPQPVQCLNLSNGHTPNTLTPGGMGKVVGQELRYDPTDPEQGLFLLAADGSAQRMPTDGVILPGSIIFMIPADLALGEYELEVRARFEAKLRAGQLPDILTVA